MTLNGADGAIESKLLADFVADHQQLAIGRVRVRGLIDQPITAMHHIILRPRP